MSIKSSAVALALAGLAGLFSATSASAVELRRAPFGRTPDGTAVEAITLTNRRGVSATIITYGAALQALWVPDRRGQLADVVLAYPDMDGYLHNPKYFGATVGRYANRIALGHFALDGHSYQLAANDGPNALHGGLTGFDKVVWTVTGVQAGPVARVTLAYVSPDGDQGYPGRLTVSTTYSLDETGALTLSYEATTTRPTIVNLTNHSYFNLSGAASGRDILGERLTILADAYLPTTATSIPQGPAQSVVGTPFDFRMPHTIGERIHDGASVQLLRGKGYDHNFVLSKGITATPQLAARLEDPQSGRVLQVYTTQPGIQFYSGNVLDGDAAGKDGYIYRQSDALALETQHFPDSPNRPDFPTTRLDPGQTYREVTVWRFSAL